MVFPFFPFLNPIESVSGSGNVFNKLTSIRDESKDKRSGLVNVGDNLNTITNEYSSSVINEGDTNIFNSASGGSNISGFDLTKKLTTKTEQTSTPSTISEKPLQFAPSILGTTAQASGESEASASGSPLIMVALLLGGGLVAYKVLGGKKKK